MQPSTPSQTTLILLTASLTTLTLLTLHRNRRIPTASHLPHTKRTLFGRAAQVNDPDNIRLYHTPLGLFPLRKPPSNLKNQTINVRIAGIDAPELAHFGKPAQPHAREALAYLRALVLGKKVRVVPLARDQYGRVVGAVLLRPWGIPCLPKAWMRDVGLDMVRAGMATVYQAKSGGEYWGRRELYERGEALARRRRRGMWSNAATGEPESVWRAWAARAGWARPRETIERPGEFKRRMKAADAVERQQ